MVIAKKKKYIITYKQFFCLKANNNKHGKGLQLLRIYLLFFKYACYLKLSKRKKILYYFFKILLIFTIKLFIQFFYLK